MGNTSNTSNNNTKISNSSSHQTHQVRDHHFDEDDRQHCYRQQQGRPIAPIPRSSHRPTTTTARPSFPSPALSFSPSSYSTASLSSSFTSSLPSPPFPSSLPSFNYSTAYPFPPFSSSSSSSSPPSPSPSDEPEDSSCHSEVVHSLSLSPSPLTPTTSATLDPTLQPPLMNLPLIGNGPGYKNGEAIALPILPTFNKKLASGRTSVPPSPTTTDAHGSTSRPLLAEAALIPSSLNPNDTQHPGAISTAGTATAGSAATNGSLHTPTKAAPACSGVAGQDNGRGGADAGILVFSGGTACNSLVQLLQDMTPNVTYVLGISDNGGSTSEILRVLDGPAIGDIRSRLIRLIKPDPLDIGRTAIKELLGYRLPGHGDENAIKNEWVEIVEGSHRLWIHIPSDKKEVIRGFLIYIQSEILKRAHKRFSFANGSIGNFFLTGARMFFGSLESAIFLFAAITGITEPTRVIPVINTNHGIAIAALLKNGHTILGQCAISHPSLAASGDSFSGGHVRPGAASASTTPDGSKTPDLATLSSSQQQEDTFSTLKLIQNNIHFDKSPNHSSSLVSRITRLYYINEYGQEIFPPPNPKLLCSLAEMETLIYSIGSLYTSIIPCLILKDVGRGIAESRSLKNKIFMLNGTNDRETPDYTALDFIWALSGALNSSLKLSGQFWPKEYRPAKYITHLIYLDNSEVQVDTWGIEKLGIECVPVIGKRDPSSDRPIYDEKHLNRTIDAILDGTWTSSINFSSSSTTANSTRTSTPIPIPSVLSSSGSVVSSVKGGDNNLTPTPASSSVSASKDIGA